MANTEMYLQTQTMQQVEAIDGGLMAQFVQWIDRSEKTTRTYMNNLRQFARYLAQNEIERPTRGDVVAYRDDLTERGLKASTVSAYLRTVKQFFKWTAANDLFPDVAATVRPPKLDRQTHRRDALEASDVLAIEESIQGAASQRIADARAAAKDAAGRMQRSTEQGKRLFAMYLLAVNVGLRTVEISRANVKDLETKGGHTVLYVWGKGHSEADQKKPLAPEVAAAVLDYLKSRTDKPTKQSPLFVATGNRSGGKRIAPTTISTLLKRAMQEAGYDSERITAHSLRHTAGTAVQQITGDLYQTQRYMRHSNPATTEIYLHNNMDKREKDTAAMLYQYYHAGAAMCRMEARA